jgi:glutamate formiminotransferase / 5-formyltetrahydrofolate cyclo-ligase
LRKVLLCEPNVSEGRDLALIERFADEIRSVDGVRLIDHSSDPDHHRSVFTYLGEPEPVLEATKRLATKVFESVDMAGHSGSHPRQGALDVAAFVPVRNVDTAEAVAIAHRFGEFVGGLGVPVYYYEDAASRPERRSLPDIRKGEYEALADKLTQSEWAPDAGPAAFNPRSGVMVTGSRFPLVAFNVNLRTDDVTVAERIARAVRHVSGGYRYVRAIGLPLEDKGLVQVSMNLVRFDKSPIARVFETVRAEAARHGVAVAGTELIGPVPLAALEDVARYYLGLHEFMSDQIIETALLD